MCRQGDPGDSLMVVLSGTLKVTNVTAEAKDVVLGFLKAGALIGEIAALDGRHRTASVVALEPTEAVTIYRRDLIPILRQSPESMFALLEGLCGRLRATNALIESYSLETDARVATCLVRLVEEHGLKAPGGRTIDLKLTQRDLGSHLGLTRETVSRTLSDFRDQGLVEMRGTSIVVLDEEGLRAIADGA
jgi:CRP-like cAMP-binding protein